MQEVKGQRGKGKGRAKQGRVGRCGCGVEGKVEWSGVRSRCAAWEQDKDGRASEIGNTKGNNDNQKIYTVFCLFELSERKWKQKKVRALLRANGLVFFFAGSTFGFVIVLLRSPLVV